MANFKVPTHSQHSFIGRTTRTLCIHTYVQWCVYVCAHLRRTAERTIYEDKGNCVEMWLANQVPFTFKTPVKCTQFKREKAMKKKNNAKEENNEWKQKKEWEWKKSKRSKKNNSLHSNESNLNNKMKIVLPNLSHIQTHIYTCGR